MVNGNQDLVNGKAVDMDNGKVVDTVNGKAADLVNGKAADLVNGKVVDMAIGKVVDMAIGTEVNGMVECINFQVQEDTGLEDFIFFMVEDGILYRELAGLQYNKKFIRSEGHFFRSFYIRNLGYLKRMLLLSKENSSYEHVIACSYLNISN
jgi:hypothetical protein